VKNRRILDLGAFVGLSIFLILIFRPTLEAKFGLVDDHEIFRFASPVQLSPQVGAPLSLGEMIGTVDAENGRVRTVFYAIRFALVNLLGTNPFLWHVSLLLMGIVTAGLLYASLRILSIGVVPSILGVGTVMLLPTSSYAWIRLGAPENVGTLFLSIAFFAIAQSSVKHSMLWDAVLVLSTLLAALTKESFILVIPALIYAQLFVTRRLVPQPFSTTSSRVTAILLGLIFVLTLGLLLGRLHAAGLASQGGSSLILQTTTLWRWLDLAGNTVWQAAGYLPLVLLGTGILRRSDRRAIFRDLVVVGIFPVLLVVPQLFLYATREFFDPRYWLPAILGIVFVNVVSLAWLSQNSSKLVYQACVAWLFFWLIAFARQTAFQGAWFRADTIALNRMLDDVAARVGYQRAVVIAAEPSHYEAIISLLYHIAQRGRSDVPVYLLLTPGESNNRSLAQTQRNALQDKYFTGYNAIDLSPAQADAIILLSREENMLSSWLNHLPIKLVEYSEPVPTFSFREREFTTIKVTYQVLWLLPK
jgi:hypothetical protein